MTMTCYQPLMLYLPCNHDSVVVRGSPMTHQTTLLRELRGKAARHKELQDRVCFCQPSMQRHHSFWPLCSAVY